MEHGMADLVTGRGGPAYDINASVFKDLSHLITSESLVALEQDNGAHPISRSNGVKRAAVLLSGIIRGLPCFPLCVWIPPMHSPSQPPCLPCPALPFPSLPFHSPPFPSHLPGWPGGKPDADDTMRPERSAPYPKRTLIFSPHPDDDVISMGGTLNRLVRTAGRG